MNDPFDPSAFIDPNEQYDEDLTEEQRLKKYSGTVSYNYLLPHVRKGLLLIVHEALDLYHVGLAFIQDDKRTVQAWLDEELLAQVDEQSLKKREGRDAYKIVIVAPFVLCQ